MLNNIRLNPEETVNNCETTRDENGRLNPVYKQDDNYFFFTETWTDSYGPFSTREEAETKLFEYCKTVLSEADKYKL